LPKKVAYDNEDMRILDIGIRRGGRKYSIWGLNGREIQGYRSRFRTWLDRRLALTIREGGAGVSR
jgi:hypothetical protein